MPQTYEITAPNGKTLEITGDRMPTEAEMNEIFKAVGGAGEDFADVETASSTTAPAPDGTWEDRGIGGKVWRPASGPVDINNRTDGLVSVGDMTVHPEDVLAAGLVGRGVVGAVRGAAGTVPRVVAGTKAAADYAAPVVKYEATKNALESIGIPSSLATAAAIAVSGYRRGAKTPAATPEHVSAHGYPRGGSAPPPVAANPPAVIDEFTAARTAKQATPTQKALNEEALAARRAAYQASQQGAPAVLPPAGPVVKASGKMQLTAPEFKEFTRLVTTRKMPLEEALTTVKSMRALATKLGGANDAEVARAVAHRARTGKW